MLYMKIYKTDDLAHLLSLLWCQADRRLVDLLDRVAQQHYGGMPCSIVAKMFRLAVSKPAKEAPIC